MENNERYTDKLAKYILFAAGAAIILTLCWFFRNVIAYILAAVVVSLIAKPLVGLLKKISIKGKHAPDWLLAALSLVLVLGCFFTLAYVIVPIAGGILKNISLDSIDTAMKGMSGGLIQNGRAAYAYLNQFPSVLPIWGVQREHELDEFISYISNPPKMTEEIAAYIQKEREELAGEFCRGCGYCMPCPVGIEINNCARMSLLLRRSPSELQLNETGQAKMKKIEECLNCGKCKSKCPYGLDTPNLLKKNYEDYKLVLAGEVKVQ